MGGKASREEFYLFSPWSLLRVRFQQVQLRHLQDSTMGGNRKTKGVNALAWLLVAVESPQLREGQRQDWNEFPSQLFPHQLPDKTQSLKCITLKKKQHSSLFLMVLIKSYDTFCSQKYQSVSGQRNPCFSPSSGIDNIIPCSVGNPAFNEIICMVPRATLVFVPTVASCHITTSTYIVHLPSKNVERDHRLASTHGQPRMKQHLLLCGKFPLPRLGIWRPKTRTFISQQWALNF